MAIPGVEAGSGRLHPRHRLPQGTWGQDKVQLSQTPCIVMIIMILSRQRRGCPRGAGARDREKLELLLRVWRETKPDTYTVTCLKTVLSAEVVSILFFMHPVCPIF